MSFDSACEVISQNASFIGGVYRPDIANVILTALDEIRREWQGRLKLQHATAAALARAQEAVASQSDTISEKTNCIRSLEFAGDAMRKQVTALEQDLLRARDRVFELEATDAAQVKDLNARLEAAAQRNLELTCSLAEAQRRIDALGEANEGLAGEARNMLAQLIRLRDDTGVGHHTNEDPLGRRTWREKHDALIALADKREIERRAAVEARDELGRQLDHALKQLEEAKAEAVQARGEYAKAVRRAAVAEGGRDRTKEELARSESICRNLSRNNLLLQEELCTAKTEIECMAASLRAATPKADAMQRLEARVNAVEARQGHLSHDMRSCEEVVAILRQEHHNANVRSPLTRWLRRL